MTSEPVPDGHWHFENRQRKTRFDDGSVRNFLRLLARDLSRGLTFSVVVSSDDALRRANSRFRNVRRTTDVLAFPDGEGGNLGDLLISAPRAARQAVERGHSVEEEIQILALHGMLHLNGYDHEIDNGEMEAVEERFRRQYGLPSAVIARSSE